MEWASSQLHAKNTCCVYCMHSVCVQNCFLCAYVHTYIFVFDDLISCAETSKQAQHCTTCCSINTKHTSTKNTQRPTVSHHQHHQTSSYCVYDAFGVTARTNSVHLTKQYGLFPFGTLFSCRRSLTRKGGAHALVTFGIFVCCAIVHLTLHECLNCSVTADNKNNTKQTRHLDSDSIRLTYSYLAIKSNTTNLCTIQVHVYSMRLPSVQNDKRTKRFLWPLK